MIQTPSCSRLCPTGCVTTMKKLRIILLTSCQRDRRAELMRQTCEFLVRVVYIRFLSEMDRHVWYRAHAGWITNAGIKRNHTLSAESYDIINEHLVTNNLRIRTPMPHPPLVRHRYVYWAMWFFSGVFMMYVISNAYSSGEARRTASVRHISFEVWTQLHLNI